MDLQVFGGLQTIADNRLDTILPSSTPSQEYGPGSVGIVNAVEDPPVGQLSPDMIFAGSISHVVSPFQSFVDVHVTERQSTSSSSAKRYAHLCLPIVPGDQERVKCTWPGCMSVLKKDGHTRHVENIHLRKVKAICPRCEREFTRTYAKTKHELTCPRAHSKRKR
ncbi:hypothetical protein CY34DRAFT_803181 [Suillus luteus UH-Slu-Lm8-n1]|uniref:C2H2-type domain-containing protein n=1 Tax=Suillus luteus UH-Slu-Lm8-n1 TaxID=930992 RepID=A0A0D0BCF6_9AGAM|nr:hypothetical protein CY34DRAFT_803181 [Suillus luteus UH-Slu-Lm8-n1]